MGRGTGMLKWCSPSPGSVSGTLRWLSPYISQLMSKVNKTQEREREGTTVLPTSAFGKLGYNLHTVSGSDVFFNQCWWGKSDRTFPSSTLLPHPQHSRVCFWSGHWLDLHTISQSAWPRLPFESSHKGTPLLWVASDTLVVSWKIPLFHWICIHGVVSWLLIWGWSILWGHHSLYFLSSVHGHLGGSLRLLWTKMW